MKALSKVPSLPLNIFNQSMIRSITGSFLNENLEVLESASTLLFDLETYDFDEVIEEIETLSLELGSSPALSMFNGCNLAEVALEHLKNSKQETELRTRETLKHLLEKFPMLEFTDSDMAIITEIIDRKTSVAMNGVYPLSQTPSRETIQHFLEVCSEVAFMEIGEDSYFIYLTSGGLCLKKQIAYAYLMVDGFIPENILTKTEMVHQEAGNSEILRALNDFFESHS